MGIIKNTAILGLYALIIFGVLAFALYYKGQNEIQNRSNVPTEALSRYAQLEAVFADWTESSDQPKSLDDFIGSKVSVLGAAAPQGGSNDLIADNEIYIRIETPKEADLRPMAKYWTVRAMGEVKSIDWKTKTITLLVEPQDYRVRETW